MGLPEELSQIHSTFHDSQLRKCMSDVDVVVSLGDLQDDERLNYVERPLAVLERKVNVMRSKEIPLVKVQVAASEGIRVDLGAGGWDARALSGFVDCSWVRV